MNSQTRSDVKTTIRAGTALLGNHHGSDFQPASPAIGDLSANIVRGVLPRQMQCSILRPALRRAVAVGSVRLARAPLNSLERGPAVDAAERSSLSPLRMPATNEFWPRLTFRPAFCSLVSNKSQSNNRIAALCRTGAGRLRTLRPRREFLSARSALDVDHQHPSIVLAAAEREQSMPGLFDALEAA